MTPDELPFLMLSNIKDMRVFTPLFIVIRCSGRNIVEPVSLKSLLFGAFSLFFVIFSLDVISIRED